MRHDRMTAGRATMISLVIHSAYLAVAVIWAVISAMPRPPDASFLGAGNPAMDIALVAVWEPPAAPPHRDVSEPRTNDRLPESAAIQPCVSVQEPNSAVGITADHVESAPSAPAAGPPGPTSPRVEPLPIGTATRFFGIPAQGQSVVFVIDRSASMGLHGRLDRARRELIASLERLPPTAQFQVIAYDRSAEPLLFDGRRGLLPAEPKAVAAAVAAIARLIPEGSTDHGAALFAALALNPDVIYFLTDDDELTPAQVRETTRRNRGRSAIHALCFIEPFGTTALDELARRNRGTFRIIADLAKERGVTTD